MLNGFYSGKTVLPSSLCKTDSEDGHQAALFCWANMASRFGLKASMDDLCYTEREYAVKNYGFNNELSCLAFMFAVPNGGKRDGRTAAKLKQTGVKPGVPDVFLDLPRNGYHGLRIEMKRPKTDSQSAGRTSGEQDIWLAMLKNEGYCVYVCYSWEEARDKIIDYIGVKR